MSFPWAKPYEPTHPLMKWMDEKLPIPRLVYNATAPVIRSRATSTISGTSASSPAPR